MKLSGIDLTKSIFINIFIYIFGLIYWYAFFLRGTPTFTALDWQKEQVFTNLIRESIKAGSIPWKISEPYYHGIYELITNPEISMTPDFLFLTLIPNNIYFLLHWQIFYTLGFIGCILCARKFKLTTLSFIIFIALFNFNGYIATHISVGHIQWAGYFLLPLFFYWLSSLASTDPKIQKTSSLKVSLVLGLMFLNGSFHTAAWCLIFLIITSAFYPKLIKWMLLVLILSLLMWSARVIPAAFYFPPKIAAYSGYPTVSFLIDSFLAAYPPSSNIKVNGYSDLGWWEYSFFIGYIGLMFLIFGCRNYLKENLKQVPSWWFPASLAMFLMSLGYVFQIVPELGVNISGLQYLTKILTLERVPSRFIAVPFFVILLVGVIGLSNIQRTNQHFTRVAFYLGIPSMFYELLKNASSWSIKSSESFFGTREIPTIFIVESVDYFLQTLVLCSWIISLATFLIVIIWLFLIHKRTSIIG